MSKNLVIVESPAKAKTIEKFLGPDYTVLASYGHVRDLPKNRQEMPADLRSKPWADFGVNVDDGFEPYYVDVPRSQQHIAKLKQAMKGATNILLATDEDREGESISWHIVEVLKPQKSTKVQRIVFHEITPEAIQEAIRNPRSINDALVRAQETRRILDRLFGYSLSPVLWQRVAPGLSAGRVQSVAVRLIVMRERERMAFHAAEYWDIEAQLSTGAAEFLAKLATIDGAKIATGESFDPTTGELKDKKVRLVDRALAEVLATDCRSAEPWEVSSVSVKPGQETPPPPFMTSTLQQEAIRKLGFSAKRTMQVAQTLYEGVTIGGSPVGLITYMRTDSLTLAERALEQARTVIRDLYGSDYLPDKPKRYGTKARNAQEAHEAIRPTDLGRKPDDIKSALTQDQFRLYELIWKRTIASQMTHAKVERTSVVVRVQAGGHLLEFHSSGKRIVFAGFLRAYVEGSDDPETELGDRETILPKLTLGQQLEPTSVTPKEHRTKPPARFTEASLVKRLEEEGIGRPSTYATIIDVIIERGYVFKRKAELVPTFTAIAVTNLLENHFGNLVDIAFTARMEEELDGIAAGSRDWTERLAEFYFGGAAYPGLKAQIATSKPSIEYFRMDLGADEGQSVVVRIGRNGPFISRGDGGPGNTASVPEQLAPAELTLPKALELLRPVPNVEYRGENGQIVELKKGRYGAYLEVSVESAAATSSTSKRAASRPKRVTIPSDINADTLTESTIVDLLKLPRIIGVDPSTQEEITASTGQFGAYLKRGSTYRNLEHWRLALTVTLEDAIALFAQEPARTRGRAQGSTEPIQSFGELAGAKGPVRVLKGRYGPYVTDGKVNATIPRGEDPSTISAERALALLQAKADAPKTRGKARKKASPAKRRRSA